MGEERLKRSEHGLVDRPHRAVRRPILALGQWTRIEKIADANGFEGQEIGSRGAEAGVCKEWRCAWMMRMVLPARSWLCGACGALSRQRCPDRGSSPRAGKWGCSWERQDGGGPVESWE